ncbi:MAG: flagellar basal body-associated FliL family protein [Rhodobacteraceae bacterium]|nr:flagellar basal body-associated FliL family protein [Paracoccaceae bacterium]MCB2120779.1 flagellar basal body-associated FliL family protein [Paracoccaceae bacterium]MCB2122402.1 flagellar basal body-associated FliL family protein [Paracoccaceae bacterium]
MKGIVPIVLVLAGVSGGAAGGFLLRPAPEQVAELEEPVPHDENDPGPPESDPSAATRSEVEYVKLNNQFVVPVMEGAEIQSLVILSLSVEVAAGQAELVYAREPKLRDTFLRVLFDHANMGGFDGPFTQGGTLESLRRGLRAAAREVVGTPASDVLILDIIRQRA